MYDENIIGRDNWQGPAQHVHFSIIIRYVAKIIPSL